MARLGARLVRLTAAVALGCALGGCFAQPPSLPQDIYVDSRFNEAERAMIVEMIDRWNAVGQEYLGVERMLTYRGVHFDPDGFTPNPDLGDDVSVIYRGENDAAYAFINTAYQDADRDANYNVVGYGTLGDVIVWPFQLVDQNGDLQPDAFRHVVLHELGHRLAMQHVPGVPEAVMFWATDGKNFPLQLTKTDLQAFCCVYECIKQP